jgi:putative ABC transport system permease protein
MNVKLGDKLTFDVQGALMDTYIGSMRKVDFRQMQTNFLVVFPTGVLENAPQFHVLVTKVPSNQISAQYQQALIKDFPNISVVDLALIIQTLEDVISKISFVIRFMALFSMVTGLLVLFGSVLISKFQRIKETVLLRTLGASGKQIIWITALEYAFLGMLSSFVGILLSLAGSWALAIYSFESRFAPSFLPILLIFLSITAITVLIGVLNNRDVLQKPPLEVLRNEV